LVLDGDATALQNSTGPEKKDQIAEEEISIEGRIGYTPEVRLIIQLRDHQRIVKEQRGWQFGRV